MNRKFIRLVTSVIGVLLLFLTVFSIGNSMRTLADTSSVNIFTDSDSTLLEVENMKPGDRGERNLTILKTPIDKESLGTKLKDGEILPSTTKNISTYLLVGIALLAVGFIIFMYNHRKKVLYEYPVKS